MIKAAIFDFDGTIANTLFDLQDSINEALKMNGFSREYTFEETLSSRSRNFIRIKEKRN